MPAEQHEEHADAQQRQRYHDGAHHRAAGEGHAQPLVQAVGCCLRRAHVGAHGNIHADVTGQTGGQRATHEGDCRPDAHAGTLQAGEQDEHERDDHDQDADRAVFAGKEGLGAALDSHGDTLHALVAGVLRHNEVALPQRECQPDQAGDDPQRSCVLNV